MTFYLLDGTLQMDIFLSVTIMIWKITSASQLLRTAQPTNDS